METAQNSQEKRYCNPENNPILGRWEQVLSGRASDPAIFSPEGRVLRTFAALEREASFWWERLEGLAPGAVLAVQLPNGPEWPAVLLAAWRRGLVVAPFEAALDAERRRRLEELCGVAARIEGDAEIDFGEMAPALLGRKPEGCHFLKITSGTSGEPRGIRFTAEQLLADCDAVCDGMGLEDGDVNYGLVSFAHSYGFSNLVTPLLCRGIPVVAAGDAMPRAVVEGLHASRATVLPAVPAIFRTLAEFPACPDSLRLCISAGAPLSGEVARRFAQGWRRKIHSFYGASECGGICYDVSEDMDVPQGYVGTALGGVGIEWQAEERPSLVRVSGAAVGLGYFPEEGEALGGGVYEPPDLLERVGEGLVIRGRVSDTINVAGRKVNPLEVERVLAGLPGVEEAVVFGMPASSRGEEVAACVVGEAGEPELKAQCASRLPAWQVPKRWFFVEAIPLNARGKISRNDLRRLFSS